MYLRPRMIFEKLAISARSSRVDEEGNVLVDFKAAGAMRAVLSTATPYEREKYKSLKHEVTHTAVQKLGGQRAQIGDMLLNGRKKYLVQAVEDPAGLGQYFVYYLMERNDL